MRGIIPLALVVVGLLAGLWVGLSVASRVRDVSASSMSVARFLARSEAQAVGLTEGECGALWVRWRLRHSWPDWGTP